MNRDLSAPIKMETFFTPSMIFLLAGIGFIGIVLLHLIVLLVHKISKNKEYTQQQLQQTIVGGATSECNVSVRGAGVGELNVSRETLESQQAATSNKCDTLRSVRAVHSINEPKTKLNTKLEKLVSMFL